MKKFLAILLALIMTISMGTMLLACDDTKEHTHKYEWVDNGDGTHKQHCSEAGCDKPDINAGNHDYVNWKCVCGAELPDVTDVTLETLMSNINLEKGLTIKVAADGEIDIMGSLMGTPGEMSPLVISDETKIALSNGALKMDNKIDLNIGEGKSEIVMSPRIYVRNNKTYVGLGKSADQSNDEIIFTASEATIDDNTQISDQIAEILPMLEEELGAAIEGLLKAPLPFTKDGDVFKAQVDVLTPVAQAVNMFAGFINDITVDTTVGDLYTKIGGKKMLEDMLGKMTGKEAYATIIGAIKELPEGTIPAEELAQIPEDVDAFIAFVEAATGIDLPEMGNKTLAQYIDETIALFADITIFDIFYAPGSGEPQPAPNPENPDDPPHVIVPAAETELTPEEEIAAAKAAMQAELDAFKATLRHIAKKLTTNKLELSFEVDRKGMLASVKADITLDYEVMNKLISSIMGSMFSETEPEVETNDKPALTMSITASVEYAATTFVDETKLVTEDTYRGAYKLVSVTETIGTKPEIVNTYKVGDKYGDVTLSAETVEFAVADVPAEWDPEITELGYSFKLKMFDPSAPFVDEGTMSIGEKGYGFYQDNYDYTMDCIYINADGTFTLEMYYDDEDGVTHSFAFFLEKAE